MVTVGSLWNLKQELIKNGYFLLHYASNIQINCLVNLNRVFKILGKENNIFQDVRISTELVDSALLRYCGTDRRLDILLI